MLRTDVAVIGGGQAGLAMSRCLTDRGIDHVILERGRIAQRWRSGSWDRLRLLTPNWMTALPGERDAKADPNGFLSVGEWVLHLERYGASFAAPVLENTEVTTLDRCDTDYRLTTNRGEFRARAVVIATGQCESAKIPAVASRLPRSIHQLSPSTYRRPVALSPGGVLVVGASASGIQIADELRRAGRKVMLAVGRHTRLPRRYRGHDIMVWLRRLGVLDDRAETVADIDRVRRQPSLQLHGGTRRLDLATLRDAGVTILGRAAEVRGDVVRFDGDLSTAAADADRRLFRLLTRIDTLADSLGAPRSSALPKPLRLDAAPTAVALEKADIATVIWATGYAPRYPWLRLPVLDPAGAIRHCGGVVAEPGLYALGLSWLRRRASTFIYGTGADACELAQHIAQYLRRSPRIAA